MSTLTQFMGGTVKSVQRGIASYSSFAFVANRNVTISSVNTSKSVIIFSGGAVSAHTGGGAGVAGYKTGPDIIRETSLTLTSSTNLRIQSSASFRAMWVTWQVVEYY